MTLSTSTPPQAASSTPVWQVQGPGTATIESPNSFSANTFNYSLSGAVVWNIQQWSYSAKAPVSGLFEFDWNYAGFHAWFRPSAKVVVFAERTTGQRTEVTIYEGSTSGGWDVKGTASIQVTEGYTFGFVIQGKNGDSTSQLRGTLKIAARNPSWGIKADVTKLLARIQELEAALAAQKKTYEETLAAQKKAHEDTIATIQNINTNETKDKILEGIRDAQTKANEAQATATTAELQVKVVDAAKRAALAIVALSDAADLVQKTAGETQQLARDAEQSAATATRLDFASAAAIAAQNFAQTAQDMAAQANAQVGIARSEEASGREKADAVKQKLDQLQPGVTPKDIQDALDAAEPILQALYADEGNVTKLKQIAKVATSLKSQAQDAVSQAAEQANKAAQNYDNWDAVEKLFGFQEGTSGETSTTPPVENGGDSAPGDFAFQDANWQMMQSLFHLPDDAAAALKSPRALVTGLTSNGTPAVITIRRADGYWLPFGDVEGQTGDRGAFIDIDCASVNGELQVCGVSSDGHLWHTIHRIDGSWSQFGDVETQTGDRGNFVTVGIAEVNGELHVCGISSDGHLWHTIRHANSWSQFSDVEGQTGDRGSFTDVACVGVGGELQVCGISSDGHLWHTIRHANSWSQFGDVETQTGDRGNFVTVGIAEVNGELHVCGISSDGHLWHTIRHANSWSQFSDVEGQAGDRGSFTDVDCVGVGGELQVCGVSSDGHLWYTIRRADGSWSPFSNVEEQTGDRKNFARISIAEVNKELQVCGVSSDGHLWQTIRRTDASITNKDQPVGVVISTAANVNPLLKQG